MSQTKAGLLALASFVVFALIALAIMASVTDEVGILAFGPLVGIGLASLGVHRSLRGAA